MGAMKELSLRLRDREDSWADIYEIAEALGGEVDGDMVRCPSPGHPPDDRSCHVRINAARPSSFFIYDCEGPTAAAYSAVRKKLKLINLPSKDNSAFALSLFKDTSLPQGTLVETYLRSRGITLPIPPCLRFHPALRHSGSNGIWPAMVASRSDAGGAIGAIHRTFLARDGSRKASIDPARMDLGRSVGSAIRLSPLSNELLIGEGIETTLSAMQATDRPGWAAGSAAAMRAMALPSEVRCVTLLADGDDAGEAAVRFAARRWETEGKTVRIARAPKGKDFNDLLIEGLRHD